eukprot:TRINITY_DN20199_c0_g1_i1.p1 TRINITY_DN20199_c0_g1~~TRINITY_DN20199_c0_g1_i1.p1  ORF type:complete len:277 (+),score=19.56 TRINITY_DN20199_c0_g1_i1:88-918(+)
MLTMNAAILPLSSNLRCMPPSFLKPLSNIFSSVKEAQRRNKQPAAAPCMSRSRFTLRASGKQSTPEASDSAKGDETPSVGPGSSAGPQTGDSGEYQRKLWDNMLTGEFGKRGEEWVAAQVILCGLVLFPPSFVADALNFVGLGQLESCGVPVPGIGPFIDLLIGPSTLLTALTFMFYGVMDLGANLTPLPKPTPDSQLVTSGVYRLVRHPLYAGLVLAAAAITKLSCSPSRLLFAVALWQVLERKVQCEEDFLVEKYGAKYIEYRKIVKKFIPFVY